MSIMAMTFNNKIFNKAGGRDVQQRGRAETQHT